MDHVKSTPKLTIEEEIYFRSSLDYIFRHYKSIVLYGITKPIEKLLTVAAPHHRAVIKYIVLEGSEELSIQNIPVRSMNAKPEGVDLVVVCADRNESEYVARVKKWVGGSVQVFAAVSDTVILDAVRFGGENPGDRWPTEMYILCTLERTGSTMLASLLRRTELLGIPGERFTNFLKQYVDDNIISYDEIVPEIFKRYQTPNGVFGVKIHQYQFPIFDEAINSIQGENRQIINNLLAGASYIFLVRRNLYEQAISLWRAQQTRTYHIYNRSVHKGQSRLLKLINPRVAVSIIKGFLQRKEKALPPYNYEELRRVLLELIDDRDVLRSFFKNNEIAPLILTYEDFTSDLPLTIAEIANHVGVHVPEERTFIDPVTRKMADEYTMEILGKFKRDLKGNDSRLFDEIERLIQDDIGAEWK